MTRPGALKPDPGDALDRYGCDLAWRAAAVIEAVHELGPADVEEAIQHVLALPAPDGRDPYVAAMVAVAAAVKPASYVGALEWVRGLDPLPEERHTKLLLAGRPSSRVSLTEDKVRAIRRAAATGRGYADIGREYGIKRNYVREIVLRNTWAHLPDDEEPAQPERQSA